MHFSQWFPDDQWGFQAINIKNRTYVIKIKKWNILQISYFVKGVNLCSLKNINTLRGKSIMCYKFEAGRYFVCVEIDVGNLCVSDF